MKKKVKQRRRKFRIGPFQYLRDGRNCLPSTKCCTDFTILAFIIIIKCIYIAQNRVMQLMGEVSTFIRRSKTTVTKRLGPQQTRCVFRNQWNCKGVKSSSNKDADSVIEQYRTGDSYVDVRQRQVVPQTQSSSSEWLIVHTCSILIIFCCRRFCCDYSLCSNRRRSFVWPKAQR